MAMRIAEIVNSLDEVGGTERLLVDLSRNLVSRGHELTVICLRTTGGPLAEILAKEGVEVVALQKPEGPSLPTLWRLVRHLRRRRINVIHSHNPLVHHYGVIGGKLAGVPAIVNTIHGISNLSRRPGVKEYLYRLSCYPSGRIVAVCPLAFREFRAAGVIPLSKLSTINNGIPIEPFVGIPRRPPDGNFVFGIVGRLMPVKDHRSLLMAFSKLLSRHPRCRLEILGDGMLQAELKELAAQLGVSEQTLFHGFSADVSGFLSRIDISVLSSVSEGLPLSVLESMAAGLPIVATDVGGVRDLVEGAECGWICPPKDPDALAEAMLSALASPPGSLTGMGLRAREFVVRNYSLERMTEEYEHLFAQLLRGQ